jgi:hypothetical protein
MAEGQNGVREVVAAGHLVEHPGHVGRLLVQTGRVVGADVG